MKATDTPIVYESTIAGETATFSIAGNRKMFKILMDGLYSNKIRAVIREVMSNALDSHITAGMAGIPFDVHLPNAYDPTFRVRDYGVSLSHDDVMNFYTKLGESSKDQSNEVTGMLGLGCKSPFAVADAFVVIARLDGEKRTYQAAFGADGVPTMQLIFTEESDEAQGLEVAIPVETKDFNEFTRELRFVSAAFDPVPNVDGMEIETAIPVYMAGDATFAVYNKSDMPIGASLGVRQGCVIYPVAEYEFQTKAARILRDGATVILDVPIGAVGITPSRETLQFDSDTKRRLHTYIDNYLKRVDMEIEDSLDHCTNILEATRYWYGGENKFSGIFSLTPQFRGQPLNSFLQLKGGKDWEVPGITWHGAKYLDKSGRFEFNLLDKMLLIIKRSDEKVVRPVARLKAFCEGRRGYMVKTGVLTDPTPRQIERLMTLLGLRRDQIIKLSDVPDPGPAERAKQTKSGLAGVYRLDGYYRYYGLDELDMDSDFLWVEVPGRMNKEECYNYNYSLQKQIKLWGDPFKVPMIVFTGTAVARYKPDSKKNFHTVSARLREQNRTRDIATLADHYVSWDLGADLCKASGLPYRPLSDVAIVADRLGIEYSAKAREIASQRTQAVRERYPLLFSAHLGAADRQSYMHLVDTTMALSLPFFIGMSRLAHS